MRIVQIITSLSVGGAELLLVNSCNGLCQEHEITVIYLKEYAPLKTRLDPRITAIHVPLGRRAVTGVRKLLKHIEPDVVHTHLGHADLIGFLAATGLRCKLFCTMHNIWYKFNSKDRFIFLTYRLLLHTVAAHCRVICISKSVQRHVLTTLKVPAARTKLLYNGIPDVSDPLSKEKAREEVGVLENEFVLLSVGRLEKQKSHATLIKAVPMLAESITGLKVIILGDGSLKGVLVSLAEELGIADMVDFRGVQADPVPYYQAADVFVLSSIFEGLGLVILEAFRSGLPIVASKLEGPEELISSGENGLLFRPGDSGQLADCVLRLYRDPNLSKSVGSSSKQSFETRFSLSNYIAGLNTLYMQ